MKADLHLHTTASDGSYQPEEMVAKAKELGFGAIAITDHDTTAGIEPALEAGNKLGIEVIPGVELSTDASGKEIHILGYLMDIHDQDFNEILAKMREARLDRTRQIVEKLRDLGFEITFEEIKQEAGEGALGRPHVARVMVDKGYAGSIKEVFDKYLSIGKPAHVPRFKITPDQAVELIRKAKGVPVLAHPGGLGGRKEIIDNLCEAGLLGIEAYHSDHTPAITKTLIDYAQEKGLLVTGGSDCHGPHYRKKALMGTIALPYEHVVALKDKQAELLS